MNQRAVIAALLIVHVGVCVSAVSEQIPRSGALAKIPYLGIAFRWQRDRNSDKYLHVERVSPASPAQLAGVLPGDIITRIQGIPVGFGDELDFLLFMNERKVGEQISLDLVRSGSAQHIVVTLGELPESHRANWERGLAIAKQRRLAGPSVR
jgi:S1-C subfamily serine protease